MPSPAPKPLLVALIVACAFFMQNLDGTVISLALPQMAVSFGTSAIYLSIGITAYIMTLAVFIPVSGWVADRFGTRTVFRSAIAIFTIGSILCGTSAGLWTFTGARVIQGIGGAMMVPVGQLVVLRSAPKNELVRSMNFIAVPGLLAPVIGPPLGGFITTYASWHWIFFLNVPIGVLGIVLASLYVPEHRAAEKRPLDLTGFILTGAGLVCLMYGLELIGHRNGARASFIVLLMAGGAILAVLAVRHARRHPHPLVNLTPLGFRTYAVSVGAGSLFRLTVGASPFLLPLMLQIGFGLSAFTAGMLVLAHAAGDVAMKGLTRRLLRRFGFRRILIGNGLLVAAWLVACALFQPETPAAVIVLVLFLGGAFRSLQFTSLNTLGYADIPTATMSAATTLSGMVQQIAFGSGVAFAAILLQLGVTLRHAGSDVPVTADFHLAFLVVAVAALVSALGFIVLDRHSGAEVSGHRPLPKPAAAGD